MPRQLGNAVKEERSRVAGLVAKRMSQTYRQALVNTCQEVLFEEPEDGYFTGHAPNYVKVYVKGEGLHNRLCRARITEIFKDGVLAELI